MSAKSAPNHFSLNEFRNNVQSYYKFRTFVPTWGYDFRYCRTIPFSDSVRRCLSHTIYVLLRILIQVSPGAKHPF